MITIDTMKQYFENGLWTIDRLKNLLSAGKITDEEYKYITEQK